MSDLQTAASPGLMRAAPNEHAAGPRATRWLFAPVVAPLLRQRGVSLCLAIAGALQVGLTLQHAPAISCPFLEVTGVPCPGCGVSRACAALVRGHWQQSVQLHVFAPLFLVAIGLFAMAAALPNRRREAMAARIEAAEARSGVTILLLTGLMLYWLVRLLYGHIDFARLPGG